MKGDEMANTKARAEEIYTAAVFVVAAAGGPLTIDKMNDSQARLALYRKMYQDVIKATGCSVSSAKNNIAKAMRRARGELIKAQWGGARAGAGYPKGEPRKNNQ